MWIDSMHWVVSSNRYLDGTELYCTWVARSWSKNNKSPAQLMQTWSCTASGSPNHLLPLGVPRMFASWGRHRSRPALEDWYRQFARSSFSADFNIVNSPYNHQKPWFRLRAPREFIRFVGARSPSPQSSKIYVIASSPSETAFLRCRRC
jgi:hypothetical protein